MIIPIHANEEQCITCFKSSAQCICFARLIAQERTHPARWHYISFAASDGFRGAVVMMAHGVCDALSRLKAQGNNPGGEVIAVPITREQLPPLADQNRLLSAADILRIWPDSKSIGEFEAEEIPRKRG